MDMIGFAAFSSPTAHIVNRYDLGWYVTIPYIPLFGKKDNVKG